MRNLALRPALDAARTAARAAYDGARDTYTAWLAAEQAMHAAYEVRPRTNKRFTPAAQHARLAHATHQLHTSTEELAVAFRDGHRASSTDPALDVGAVLTQDAAFARTYRAQRTAYHRHALFLAHAQHAPPDATRG